MDQMEFTDTDRGFVLNFCVVYFCVVKTHNHLTSSNPMKFENYLIKFNTLVTLMEV